MNEYIYTVTYTAADLTVRYCSLLMPWLLQEKEASEEEGKARQAGSWLLDSLSEGACQQFLSQLCLVSLHAGSGLCCSRLLHTASAQALQRAVSFLISARWVDNAVHETLDSPSWRFYFFFLTLENIHMYFVKEYAGFLLLFCCYSCTGAKLPRGRYFRRLIIKAPLCYSYFIVEGGKY